MLVSTRLPDADSSEFTEVWNLYTRAFPYEERRSLSCHLAAMQAESDFYCLHLSDFRGFVGLIFYWVLQECVYVEHLAIAETRRGSGLGKRALQLLLPHQLPVILEIEPVVDSITQRRLRFYESAGFHSLPYLHYQLPYHIEGEPLQLTLLSYPHIANRALFDSFERDFRERVMHYRESVLLLDA